MRKIAFALALVTVTPAAAVDVMFNTPLDTTPATLILAAKALGVWNTISNQIIEDQIDAYGNHWSLYVAGNGVCPGVTGYVAFMRYLGSPFSSGMTPPVLTSNIAIGGTMVAPTFTWVGSSPSPSAVTMTLDTHSCHAWM